MRWYDAASVALALLVPGLVRAQVQGGAGSSNSQSGGVTAGTISTLNYYSLPPVTDQERAIALERLNLSLTELAIYRERPNELGEMSRLETTRTDRIARRLYLVLSNFFDPTIGQTKSGKDLLAFKRRYNLFARSEVTLEQRSLEYIGQHGPTKFSGAWDPLLHFMILRTYRGKCCRSPSRKCSIPPAPAPCISPSSSCLISGIRSSRRSIPSSRRRT